MVLERLNVNAQFLEIFDILCKHGLVVLVSDGCHQRINIVDSRQIDTTRGRIGGCTKSTCLSGESPIDFYDWIQVCQVLNCTFFALITADFNTVLELVQHGCRESLNGSVIDEFVPL